MIRRPPRSTLLSLHDALPIYGERLYTVDNSAIVGAFDLKTGKELWHKSLGTLQKGSPVLADGKHGRPFLQRPEALVPDRKSTRLNSSHSQISYAVFCLKKKNQ